MDELREWISLLFFAAWGGSVFLLLFLGILDLYRLRMYLFVRHRGRYKRLHEGRVSPPGFLDTPPRAIEFRFIFGDSEDIVDEELIRLRARVRRKPRDFLILMLAGLVGAVLLSLWQALSR